MAVSYAAFADSPEARAVQGALQLDTLVVAPAGNDGPAGPAYGSISSPGGAPAALTVGAADLRARRRGGPGRGARRARPACSTGRLPLAGAVVSTRPLERELAAPHARRRRSLARASSTATASASSPAAPRSSDGGADPQLAIEYAARAGAAAVVLYGAQLPGRRARPRRER